MRTASLPMYALPEMRPHNDALWHALATHLATAGIPDLPPALQPDRLPVPDAIGPEILFTQTCGYPLQTIYRGQHAILGIPEYDAPGCDGPTHGAFFVVRENDHATTLEQLRGYTFACNSIHSNSGMNLPRRTLAPIAGAPIAGAHPFFSRVLFTGSHPGSMALVRSGEADVASIDNVTWAFHADHRPHLLHGLRILAPTVPSPAIPFVTSSATDAPTAATLRDALHHLSTSPDHAATRRALRLVAIHPPEAADYAVLSAYEAESAALGYATLA